LQAVTSDIIARYNRVYGRDVFFQTGTDEHGQKIANTAAVGPESWCLCGIAFTLTLHCPSLCQGLGIKPIEMCDKYVAAFKALNRLLRISNNFFIRTSMEFHHKSVSQSVSHLSPVAL
jgi:methionyl-tRNA synthetase